MQKKGLHQVLSLITISFPHNDLIFIFLLLWKKSVSKGTVVILLMFSTLAKIQENVSLTIC